MVAMNFLGCLYYTLGNIHPKFRSSLKSIQLLSIVKYSCIVDYGIDVILEPVVEAIMKLEQVKKLNKTDIIVEYFFTLLLIESWRRI